MTPWLDDGDVRLYHGDALEQLALMPSESVQCIVTSPPFWGLRDYGTGRWLPAGTDYRSLDLFNVCTHVREGNACIICGGTYSDPQIGLEETPDEWCARLVAVFREARRVLRSDGVCWIEVGDTYNSRLDGSRGNWDSSQTGKPTSKRNTADATNTWSGTWPGAKPKDLIGAPWLLAFALRADGWYLRSDTIWARPNPMPESVTDRPTKAHSYVFLLTKSARYFYDADAIREEALFGPSRPRDGVSPQDHKLTTGGTFRGGSRANDGDPSAGRNARSVWSIATEPTPFAHFATFPQALVERCIKAGTSEHGACSECGAPWRRITEREARTDHPGGKNRHHLNDTPRGTLATVNGYDVTTTSWERGCDCVLTNWRATLPVPCVVLDPFMGSGTTALVARRLGRHATGIELNSSYLEIAAKRLQQLSLFAEPTTRGTK